MPRRLLYISLLPPVSKSIVYLQFDTGVCKCLK